ncbi:MAG TPA: ATP-binding protein [Anaerolineales bacterium]|jgi:hypothetical protein
MVEFPWEDNLLERKVESDLKDLLKTLVAFANSVQPGHIATLLIGEKDDGSIQGVTDPDNIQKHIRRECEKIYPPILWRSSVYENNGKFCIRVEIEYNGETPHFGGIAWVRQGSETKIATDEIFQRLIDLRLGIVHELAKWLEKEVTVNGDISNMPASRREESIGPPIIRIFKHRWEWEESAKIVFVNNYWVTFERLKTGDTSSEPLSKLTLSFDNKNNRLKIMVAY